MTEFDQRVEAGALEILNARLRMQGLAEFTLEEVQALSVVWPAVVADARAILAVTEPMHAEEMARIADEYAKQNRDQARKARSRMTKANRIGDPFEHGAVAEMGMVECEAAANEADAIAAAIREAGKDRT